MDKFIFIAILIAIIAGIFIFSHKGNSSGGDPASAGKSEYKKGEYQGQKVKSVFGRYNSRTFCSS